MADERFDFALVKKVICQHIDDRENDLETKHIETAFQDVFLGSDLDKKACCDQAFKECLQKLILGLTSSEILPSGISLVKFAIACARHSLCTSSTPVLLLSDLSEILTIEKCLELFSFVEESVPVWTCDVFFASCKNHLLRMCNDIMRRLSKSQNNVFCGRILLFLARLFPLEEKSALNLMSHFNAENVTIFRKQSNGKLNDATNSDGMDTEEGELTSGNPIDFALYVKLWSVQEFFSNPSKCYTPVGWRTMRMSTIQVTGKYPR